LAIQFTPLVDRIFSDREPYPHKAMPVSPKKSKRSFIQSGCRLAASLLLSGTVVSSFEGFLWIQSAQAAPTRKDWCGTVWSVENTSTLAWINPATGLTTSASGPTTQIAMPGGSMGTSVAAIGIHKESGTMFAFDRNGATGTLYKYRFGVDTAWQSIPISGLVGLTGTQSIPGASNNLNKMTVDGNNLYIADSTAIALYTISLNSTGAVISAAATSATYTFVGDPVGTPAHTTAAINGGDITTDEYGDTYNITYTSTTAYFYKQDSTAKTWIYQGQTPATAAFAGAAFYKGDLYVKAGAQLKKVDLSRSGSAYTGWNSALVNIGSPSATSSADLTSCGDPNLSVTKNQQFYTDATATTLAADQTKVRPGEYVKYTITVKNIGDAWARSSNIADNLPIGTSYVPNTATLNGTNLGLTTYPAAGFPINSPGLATGIVPYAPDPDTAILTFVAQVTATAGSIKNRATAAYVDDSGLPSEPPNCTTGLNCGETPTTPIDDSITVSGNVFHDANGDVTINGSDAGTNAGPANLTVYAIDATGKVVSKSVVAANGSYTLTNIPANSTVTLRLANDATVAVGSTTPPAMSLPTNWTNTGENQAGVIETTTPGEMSLTTALTNLINEDFGIEQLPDTTNLTPAAQPNPGGIATVPVPTLTGLDPEDGALGSGKSFKIVTLPTNATLTYNNTPVIAGQVIASYDPTLLKLDPDDGAITVSFTYAAIDGAGQSDPTPATVKLSFTAATPSICSVAGGIRGTNLFANNGTFGTGSLTPATSVPLPPGRTTYNFQNYGSASPNDGNYAIVNQLNQNTFSGSWHNTFGHTTGTVNDQVMLINAAATPGTFYTEILTVPANQNIEFSAWILNLVKSSWSAILPMDPNISFVINRIGVDDNNNGIIDEPGEGQVITNSGLVPKMSTPTWLNYGAIINTGNATQIEFRLVNNAPGGNGNDLLLDDLFAAPCSPLPQGDITGTLYRDINTNNLYNSGTDTTMPTNIAVNLKSATGVIVATAYTDASGNYNFTNVPAGSNYTIEVALTDTDIPSGATATANPTGANTTGQQSGITVTNGATLANQNFGFLAPTSPNVLLVKRITAINGGTNTVGGDSLAGYIDELTNPYDDNNITIANQPTPTSPAKDTDKWPMPSTFLLGGINGGNIKPGDEMEYTIYFLSAGESAAKNVLFCDRVPTNVSFIPTAFNSATPATGGLAGDRGILSLLNGTTAAFTNIADGDAARYFAPGIDPTSIYPNLKCGGVNDNGAVVINLGNLPNATAPGTPAGAFGFVRFKGRVK
jgi:uncharacterized repeat protein (TIGR01451 family)